MRQPEFDFPKTICVEVVARLVGLQYDCGQFKKKGGLKRRLIQNYNKAERWIETEANQRKF